MTVSTVFAETVDGDIYTGESVYATARDGSGAKNLDLSGTDLLSVGQAFTTPTYRCIEAFLSFDTSGIPDGDVISAAVLSLWLNQDNSATDFVLNARLRDWGATLETSDFVAGASLSALPLLAHLATSTITGGVGIYYDFLNDALLANINKTGITRLILCSDRQEAGTTPTGNEWLQWASANQAGTTLDPKLVITHAAAVGVRSQVALVSA